jgi:hypothetical protein
MQACQQTLLTWVQACMQGLTNPPVAMQFLRKFSSKVDALWMERKERQKAAVDEESAKKQQEAAGNAYLQLMPPRCCALFGWGKGIMRV